MKIKWIGFTAIMVIIVVIAGYKSHLLPGISRASADTLPRVVLAAVLSEANSPGDACGDIIRVVRSAHERGIAVQEIDAGSQPDLLARYRILLYPTVIIFDGNGKEVARYVGEGPETVKAVRAALEKLR